MPFGLSRKFGNKDGMLNELMIQKWTVYWGKHKECHCARCSDCRTHLRTTEIFAGRPYYDTFGCSSSFKLNNWTSFRLTSFFSLKKKSGLLSQLCLFGPILKRLWSWVSLIVFLEPQNFQSVRYSSPQFELLTWNRIVFNSCRILDGKWQSCINLIKLSTEVYSIGTFQFSSCWTSTIVINNLCTCFTQENPYMYYMTHSDIYTSV